MQRTTKADYNFRCSFVKALVATKATRKIMYTKYWLTKQFLRAQDIVRFNKLTDGLTQP